MTNKAKLIFLNLLLLAGITFSMKSAYADLSLVDDGSSPDQDQLTAQSANAGVSAQWNSSTGPEGHDDCSLIPVNDGCSVCAGCSGQCSFSS